MDGGTSGSSSPAICRRGHDVGNWASSASTSRPWSIRSNSSVPFASYLRNRGSPVRKTKKRSPPRVRERQADVEGDVEVAVVLVARRAQRADAPERASPMPSTPTPARRPRAGS